MTTSRILLSLAALSLCMSVSAQQQRQQLDRTNPDLVRTTRTENRTEIIIPDIDGFKVVKTDLHAHTIYSDGEVTPQFRMKEAWRNGLDAIAITDHIEYHSNDKSFAAYLGLEKPESQDLNYSVELARSNAKAYGLTLIPGTEITRNPKTIGHFNALFTTDNNLIPDPDPFVAIQNAKKQGAIIQINHPGWARTDANLTETAKRAISEGLADGVECYNDNEFYKVNIQDAIDNNLYVCANTDIHSTIADRWGDYGEYRNMTLVLAKDTSAEAIKEGLLARRTLAYGYGDISGSRELLEKLFRASFDFKVINVKDKGRRDVLVTNKSSFAYYLITDTMPTGIKVNGLSSVIVHLAGGEGLKFTVQNMWYGVDRHPVVSIEGI